ncbi:MAG: (Fe-S)-binding protein [Syntrophales bacterium]|nr:(Fe-S)-binding protein [Syntrophales bacterium]
MSKVSLFIPCLVDMFAPSIGMATVAILERLGVETVYHDEQTCCGQPALNAGYGNYALEAARRFISIFGDDEVIVSPAGSCVYMIKRYYPELLEDDPLYPMAVDLSSRVYELSQYLVDVLDITDVGAQYEGKVAYHESCHILRGLGISRQPKVLLSKVKGTEIVPLFAAEMCCGFGGEFADRYHYISEEMVKDKVNNFQASGADVLITCEPGCYLNLNGFLHRQQENKKVLHLAQLLAGPEFQGL